MDIARAKTSNDRVGEVHEFAKMMQDAGLFRNCLNCLEWSEPTHLAPTKPHGCSKYREMPPPKVIVVGCKSHTDLVPF